MNEHEFPGFNDEGVEFITVAPQFTFNHQIQKEAVSEFRQKGTKISCLRVYYPQIASQVLMESQYCFFTFQLRKWFLKFFLGFFKAGIEL